MAAQRQNAVPKERDKEPRESQETGMKGKREREMD